MQSSNNSRSSSDETATRFSKVADDSEGLDNADEEQDARILNALGIIINLQENLEKLSQAAEEMDLAIQKEALKNQNMIGIYVKNSTIQSQFEELIQLKQEENEILKGLSHPEDQVSLDKYDQISNYSTRLLKYSQKKLLSFSPDSQKICEPFLKSLLDAYKSFIDAAKSLINAS